MLANDVPLVPPLVCLMLLGSPLRLLLLSLLLLLLLVVPLVVPPLLNECKLVAAAHPPTPFISSGIRRATA